MHRYGIEDEDWFETARSGLERRGFRLRIQQRSIVVEKEGRLPRLLGTAVELLEFAERQGVPADQAAMAQAERYGNERADVAGRRSASVFETPVPARAAVAVETPSQPVHSEPRRAEANTIEARMAELQLEQEKIAAERQAAQAIAAENAALAAEKQALEERCRALAAELRRALTAADETAKQRDLWQMSANSAEDRLRLLEMERDAAPVARGGDKRFEQLRRFLARELHPDLAGENSSERGLREALFKRVWSKIEQLG